MDGRKSRQSGRGRGSGSGRGHCGGEAGGGWYGPSTCASMSKKECSIFVNSILNDPVANQDLQDKVTGRHGFCPGVPPDGSDAAPPCPGTGTSGDFQFFIEVLPSPTRGSRPMLPIAIDRKLPQIQLQFGLTDSDKTICPTVCGIMDSGAALCTGNRVFFTALGKAFPHIIESIIIAKTDRFAPICLSGIVKEDEKDATTDKLPVLYTLHMHYNLRLGGPVQFQVACVKYVSVRFLIGNTFLKRTVATLCYATHNLPLENLSEICVFPLICKVPSTLTIPDVARVQGANMVRC